MRRVGSLITLYLSTAWLAASVGPAPAQAGAWLQPAGEWLLIMPTTWESARDFRDADSDLYAGDKFTKLQLKPILEYGVRPWLTVGLSPDWQRLRREDPERGRLSASGLATLELSGRTTLRRTDWSALSVQATALIPGGFDTVTPFAAEYGGTNITTRFGAEARLLYGRSGLGPAGRGFAELQAGVRASGSPAQDELKIDATAGWGSFEHVTFMLQMFGTWGIGGSEPPGVDYDLVKLQLGAVIAVQRGWALQAGLEKAVAGRNTVAGGAFVLGLWRRW